MRKENTGGRGITDYKSEQVVSEYIEVLTIKVESEKGYQYGGNLFKIGLLQQLRFRE